MSSWKSAPENTLALCTTMMNRSHRCLRIVDLRYVEREHFDVQGTVRTARQGRCVPQSRQWPPAVEGRSETDACGWTADRHGLGQERTRQRKRRAYESYVAWRALHSGCWQPRPVSRQVPEGDQYRD